MAGLGEVTREAALNRREYQSRPLDPISSEGVGGASNYVISDTEPSAPFEGLQWYSPADDTLQIYEGGAFVNVRGVGGGSNYVIASTEPSAPFEGLQWYNPTDDTLRIYEGGAFVNLREGGGGTPTPTANYVIAATAPTSPFEGLLWWNTLLNEIRVWRPDAVNPDISFGAWLEINAEDDDPNYVIGGDEPTNYRDGLLWFNQAAGTLKIWDIDESIVGSAGSFVQIYPRTGGGGGVAIVHLSQTAYDDLVAKVADTIYITDVTPPASPVELLVIDNAPNSIWRLNPANPSDTSGIYGSLGSLPSDAAGHGIGSLNGIVYVVSAALHIWQVDLTNPGNSIDLGPIPTGIVIAYGLEGYSGDLFLAASNDNPQHLKGLWKINPANPSDITGGFGRVGPWPAEVGVGFYGLGTYGTALMAADIGITPNDLWAINPANPSSTLEGFGKLGALPTGVVQTLAIAEIGDDLYIMESTGTNDFWRINPNNPSDVTGDFGLVGSSPIGCRIRGATSHQPGVVLTPHVYLGEYQLDNS